MIFMSAYSDLEWQSVLDERIAWKNRAERAEAALERQQNDNYRLAADLEKANGALAQANGALAQASHRLSCVLQVSRVSSGIELVCQRADHLVDVWPQQTGRAQRPPSALANMISAYAAHLEKVPADSFNTERQARANLAREMAAIIFRAEERAKAVDLAGQSSAE